MLNSLVYYGVALLILAMVVLLIGDVRRAADNLLPKAAEALALAGSALALGGAIISTEAPASARILIGIFGSVGVLVLGFSVARRWVRASAVEGPAAE